MASSTSHVIDMRSDTVTKPSTRMRQLMAEAEVGDDVWNEDPTIHMLQATAAELFGKEAALFVPTGCMGNLLSIMAHCPGRGEEVLLGHKSHVHVYEQGNIASLAGIHTKTLINKSDGTFCLKELEAGIRDWDPHYPVTKLIAIENTHNYCGGKVLPLEFLKQLREVADRRNLPIHMDGARLFNAIAEYDVHPSEVGRYFDSASICLSKGLGAPVGSVVLGTKDFISICHRLRKAVGGGMRQVGILGAAGLMALTENAARLKQDHVHAKMIASAIAALDSKLLSVDPSSVHSNIVICDIDTDIIDNGRLLAAFEEDWDGAGVALKGSAMSRGNVRFVTHLGVSEDDVQRGINKIANSIKRLEGEIL